MGSSAQYCPANDGKVDTPAYSVRTWQTDDGLPRNTITSLTQTPNRYLWLGTPFGVIRFDGINFTRMEGDLYADFTRARSRVLYTDGRGRLWIGTGTTGIVRYNGEVFTVIDNRDGLPHPTVSTICEDMTGTVWIGCQDGSLSWVDSEDVVHPVAHFRGGPTPGAIQLVRDIRGWLWFAQRDTYGQVSEGVATNVNTIPNATVFLCPSRDGGMWLSAGDVLQKRHPDQTNETVERFPLPAALRRVSSLFEDRKGILWIGTQNEGVFRFSGRGFIREFNTSHRILSIFEDAESNIWIGSEGGGLSRLRPRMFHTLTTREGLPQSVLLSVCEDPGGNIWLSGRGSMLMKWTVGTGLTAVAGFTNVGTTCVLPKTDEGIWVGTVGWGLYSIEAGLPKNVEDSFAFRNRQIRAIHQDAQGQVWLGCLPDGLVRIADGKLTPPRRYFDQGLPNDAIWSLADDRRGNLWLGTIRGELWCYDGERFSAFGKADGLPGASIGALHFTADGDLWVGTMGGGIGRFRNGRFAFAGIRHGLADDVISSIVDDGLGFFWLSSDRGIIRVRKGDLDEFAEGKRRHFDSIWYGKDDGLANIECIGGYQPSAWRTRSGDIWFATSKGAVVVNPSLIPTNTVPPALVLERVLLDDLDVTNLHNLKFTYGDRKLDFQYAAPSFSSPEQVRFRHQLVGLDRDWMEAGMTRSASYPRLAPGRYEFRFTACNREGIWNEQPISIPFEVAPAYWQTAWFRTAALVAFGGVVAVGVRYRYVLKMRRKLRKLEQARTVEQERMRIARDIHDDLGARLTQLAFLSDMAASEVSEKGKAGERLIKLADSSREAVRSLDEIVWAVNPRKDSLPHFVDYLSAYANEFFRASNTRCRQNLQLIIPDIGLPADLRHHLFLACKEALNNASKYAQATEVCLSVNITGPNLDILIEDNGKGFNPPTSTSNGNGIANMSNRLSAIGGDCRVESEPGRGTRVRLQVRLPDTPVADTKPHEPASDSSS